mgnify:CR=1 FL=1
MKKFLVVGCGGSGAKTQAYMMDQLKAMLRSVDPSITRLPKAWQFVTIDVAGQPEPGPSGLANVPENGGRYISIGSDQQYATFDAGVSASLGAKGALGEIATWAPRQPERITTPISDGAGQYRGLGRMLTINSLRKIRSGLNQALSELFDADTDSEINALSEKLTGRRQDLSASTPIILVLSSMAGGAGASMFVDVCRALSTLPNGDPKNTAVFMYTPEIFETLADSAVVGTWPNSLAMFGEALAAQTGAATASDQALFRAAGIESLGSHQTFARLFPLGARMGAQGTVFGDGTPDTIYRGVGRALAALMASEEASNSFASYLLANTGSPDADRSFLGWGDREKLPWDVMPWATWGYAQLSMGRDRYAEYSAQRLAKTAFERLLRGHLDPANPATGEEQLQARLAERFPRILTRLQLDPRFGQATPNSDNLRGWLAQVFEKYGNPATVSASALVHKSLPNHEGMKSQDFAQLIRARLADPRLNETVSAQLSDAAYAAVHEFADALTDALISMSEDELAAHGVPYLEAVLGHLRDLYTQRVIQPMQTLLNENRGRTALATPQGLDQYLSPLSGRGNVTQVGKLLDDIAALYRPQLFDYFLVRVAAKLEPVLEDFVRTVIGRLDKELRSAHTTLELADSSARARTNLADVATNEPVAWPNDNDERIADRFKGSQNEILITEVESFPRDYEAHLLQTIQVDDPGVFDYREATKVAARAVIVGKWNTQAAEKAPADTLAPRPVEGRTGGNRAGWISKHLLKSPTGGEIRESRPAQFRARIRPADLLERSRAWIARPNDHFSNFISADLRSYMTESTINDIEANNRMTRLRAAFNEALSQARPLAAVDANLVSTIHNRPDLSRFTFSEIPLKDTRAGDALKEILDAKTNLDDTTLGEFSKVLSLGEKVRHIDVFGSYPNYSPLVFSSLLAPISRAWASRKGQEGFWTLRRSRPLPAALPLSDDERRAMVAGWIIGVTTGQIHISNPNTPQAAAHIFDRDSQTWVDFPSPMLTPPSAMQAAIDWMPAVIESVLLAYANVALSDSQGRQGSSLRPYHLLRGIYDDNPSGPTTGGVVNHPVVSHLAEFLRTGERPSQQALGADIDERHGLLREALLRSHSNAQTFVADNRSVLPGSQTEEKPWATVTSREYAKKMPLYRDLAPDVIAVTEDLLGRLEEARQQAEAPVGFDPFPGAVQPDPTRQASSGPQLPDFGGGLI